MLNHRGETLHSDKVTVNGVALQMRTGGEGPAVVLLHGVPKTGYHWRHLVPLLTSSHTVVVPDLRGLGDSSHPSDGYDCATMADDIAALMAHLGYEHYAVVGEDWGAVVGYQLAARYRGHVTALVFAEAFMPGFGFEDHTLLSKENVAGLYLPHVSFYFAQDLPEMLIAGHERELITSIIKGERTFPDSATFDAIEEYVRCYSAPGGIRSMLAIYRAMLTDAEQNREMQRDPLEIPVLALGGDAFGGELIEQVMQQFASDVTGHVFHAGHDLAEEVPEQVADVILDFFGRHQVAGVT